jgi:hypothetical protein
VTIMTAANLAALVASTGFLQAGDLSIAVTVLDARTVYGRTDYLVTPRDGHGQQWVAADRVVGVTRP